MSGDRFGFEGALFSLKSFAAAMLAYYVALRIGLPKPFWAILTCYIVSQPLAGAVLSKAVFRVIGTILGAGVAVALVPNLANAPELLTLALAIWLGLCVYVAQLDRTPRSYVFLLAGYTASIIGFPSVSSPGAMFQTAILRVQEILLGIVCASAVHGFILPRTVTARLIERVDTILGDASRWSADALADAPPAALNRDRQRLALDIFDIHQLSIHLFFDTARLLPRLPVIRALQDQTSRLLPLAEACLDRIEQLRTLGPLPASVTGLLADTRAWLMAGAASHDAADALLGRVATHRPEAGAPAWAEALTLNLMLRLGELIEVHRACSVLREALARPHAPMPVESVAALLRRAGRRSLHRDHGRAMRSALGVSASILVLCLIWIATAWPDGANAALLAGAVGAILASMDATPATGLKLVLGGLLGTLACIPYDFAMLPRVTDFVPLVAVLAPAFLLLGGLMTLPTIAPYVLGFLIMMPTAMGLSDHFSASFDGFINGNLALLLGMAAPVLTLALFTDVGASRRAGKLVGITRSELARRCLSRRAPRTGRWLSIMIDRIAYLYPQAPYSTPSRDALDEMLRLIRTGVIIDELRQVRRERPDSGDALAASTLLRMMHAHFGKAAATASSSETVRHAIDDALQPLHAAGAQPSNRAFIAALTGLRRSLFPDAPAPFAEPRP